jgi:hypothetical protein
MGTDAAIRQKTNFIAEFIRQKKCVPYASQTQSISQQAAITVFVDHV